MNPENPYLLVDKLFEGLDKDSKKRSSELKNYDFECLSSRPLVAENFEIGNMFKVPDPHVRVMAKEFEEKNVESPSAELFYTQTMKEDFDMRDPEIINNIGNTVENIGYKCKGVHFLSDYTEVDIGIGNVKISSPSKIELYVCYSLPRNIFRDLLGDLIKNFNEIAYKRAKSCLAKELLKS